MDLFQSFPSQSRICVSTSLSPLDSNHLAIATIDAIPFALTLPSQTDAQATLFSQ